MQLNEDLIFDQKKQIKWEEEIEDLSNNQNIQQDNQEFQKLLDEVENSKNIKEGSIVKGKVIRITDDYIFVDIGHKSEGEIPKEEFLNSQGQLDIKVGDEIDVFLDVFEDANGQMILSRERAELLKAWDKIEEVYNKGEIIEGTVIARVKGGLSVDIGIKAFLPGSQVDLRPVKNLDKLIGNKLQFKIIKFNKKKGNIVLSRKVILEQDKEKIRSVTLSNLKEGAVLKGIVKNITDYGVFVDLGGVDGLLHITDISWGRVSHPSLIFEIGQELDVKVLSFDEEKKRVSLGYKQLQPDPWLNISQKFGIGTKCTGKVVNITDYGAFVELDGGIEGLIHISEMSWSKRIKHPSKIVHLGEEVEVVVMSIDEQNRRISLGMKQLEPNPWDIIKEKYRVGDVIRGKIRNITDFGIFIGIEPGIDGLIHISDISWTEKIKHPGELYKKGDEVEAVILQIDPENERFSLGIKQLTEDPFLKVVKEYPVGSHVKGNIVKILDFGVFVEITKGVEGLIHVSELAEDLVSKPQDVVKIGDTVECIVLAYDTIERRISLSRKAFLKNLQGEELKEYIDSVTEPQTVMAEAFSQASQLNKDK